jgi:DNA-binding Lrp family transcriptional regulator
LKIYLRTQIFYNQYANRIKTMLQLDDLDKTILELLQKNGRASHVEIARQLKVGHTRVRDHILRMEEAGVITGYRAVINPQVLGYGIHCAILVEVDQQHNFDTFVEDLMAMDEVVEVVNLTGEYDVIIRIWTHDLAHLRDVLYNKIGTLPAHVRTLSNMVLDHRQKHLGI